MVKLPKFLNIYTKMAFVKIIKRYGTDRVLFGTDYPLHSPVKEMEILTSLGFSDADYEKIFSKNAIKVYKLD